MATRKIIPHYKREEAIKRVRKKMNEQVQNELKIDYKKGFMNEKFNKIMELKLRWELGEISKDVFMKFTKNHVIDCWAFKYMNKLKDLSAVKIQKYWRGYVKKKAIDDVDTYNISDNSYDADSDTDALENTIYVWDDKLQF
jgi:hypothetical protein